MKKCPYCAEEIQDEALKCRFCGEFLKKNRKWKGCLSSCLISLAVSILLLILFTFLGCFVIKAIFNKLFFFRFDLPPHRYPPFMGGGVEGILREFAESFKALWERLRGFLHFGPQRYTF